MPILTPNTMSSQPEIVHPYVSVELVPGIAPGSQQVQVRHISCENGGWALVAQLLSKALEVVLPQAFAEIAAQAVQHNLGLVNPFLKEK